MHLNTTVTQNEYWKRQRLLEIQLNVCFCLIYQQTKGKKAFHFSGWYNFMSEGNKFSPSKTGISGNCVSFVSNHHGKIDLGVSIQISTIIKRLKPMSFLLHYFQVMSSFCIRTPLWSWNPHYLITKNFPKARAGFLHHLSSISGVTKQLLFWNAVVLQIFITKNKFCLSQNIMQFLNCDYLQKVISNPSKLWKHHLWYPCWNLSGRQWVSCMKATRMIRY